MEQDPEQEPGVPFERRWFRLGIAIAFVHATFTLVIVLLLGIDQRLALAAAVIAGTVGGAAVTIYFLYIYRPGGS